MSLLEESPAPVAADSPAASPLSSPKFSMSFDEGKPGVITSFNEGAGQVVEMPDEPAPEPEKPAETEPTPPDPTPEEKPAEETPLAPAKDWAAILADLTPEEAKELVKANPLLKRYTDGELGSRMQREAARIAAEAAEKVRAEIVEDDKNFAKAWSEYEEIESWRDPNSDNYDPEKYQREVEQNGEYARWKADLLGWKSEREASRQPKQAAAQVDTQALFKGWNDIAIPEVKEVLAETKWWGQMPVENRRAIEAAAYNPEGNWLRDTFKHWVTGTEAYIDKAVKEASEAARIAGRNEALADRESDTPVMTNTKTGTTRTDDQILMDHAFGNSPVSPEELAAVYKRKGMTY